jgi:predicted phosphodiesterase
MRVFALSDIHTDHEDNRRWVASLSNDDYNQDVLILAGDVSDSLARLQWTLEAFASRFAKVLYVPGNHDLWVLRDRERGTSLDKYRQVCAVVEQAGGSLQTFRQDGVSIVPLLGWYDYSFGQPGEYLRGAWMDYRACVWPADLPEERIAAHFTQLNDLATSPATDTVITFSHFLPRIDVMPHYIPEDKRILYPVLGSSLLETQLRTLGSQLHVYGHSHVNRRVTIGGVTYINNAFGYPQETRIAAKKLLCIYET